MRPSRRLATTASMETSKWVGVDRETVERSTQRARAGPSARSTQRAKLS